MNRSIIKFSNKLTNKNENKEKSISHQMNQVNNKFNQVKIKGNSLTMVLYVRT